ncbi:MAG: hypothetical protein KIH69_003225 [Anaerolineae bacterium]|nr:hypothetical protein [Anaerolineae bacterium]
MNNKQQPTKDKVYESEVETGKPIPATKWWRSRRILLALFAIILILCAVFFTLIIPKLFAPTIQASRDPNVGNRVNINGQTFYYTETVKLFVDAKEFAELKPNLTGDYEYSVNDLALGLHKFSAQAISRGGYESAMSQIVSVDISPTATIVVPTATPAIPTATPIPFTPTPTPIAIITPTFSGIVSGTYYYAEDLPNLSGKSSPKQTIQLFDSNRAIGNTISDDEGKWAIKLDKALSVGSHLLQAGLFNIDGKELARSPNTLIYVITPLNVQVLQGSIITIGSSISDSGKITGTGHPSLTVKIYENESTLTTSTVDQGGYWQWVIPTTTLTGTHALNFVQLASVDQPVGTAIKKSITINLLLLPDTGADLTSQEMSLFGLLSLIILVTISLKIGARFSRIE